jgi:predicted ATPase
MIRKIKFKNYKAFKEGEIIIKPITILLGANSVGKSSIVQLLLMLQQTALSDKYKSALKLHGEFVSLGENENIFHNKNTSNDLELTFTLSDTELMNSLKGSYLEHLTDSLIRPMHLFSRIILDSEENESQLSIWNKNFIFEKSNRFIFEKSNSKIRKEAWSSKKDFINVLNKIIEIRSEIPKLIKNNKISKELKLFRRRHLLNFSIFSESEPSEEILKNYGNLFDLLKAIGEIDSSEFELSFIIKNIKMKNKDSLKVIQISIQSLSKKLLEIKFDINKRNESYSEIQLNSDLLNTINLFSNSVLKEMLRFVNYESTIFNLFDRLDSMDWYLFYPDSNLYSYSTITSIILNIFNSAIENLKNTFGKELINYVSPLRAHPKRYYFLDKAKINTVLDTVDGDSLTEILKENDTVQKKVNNWLKSFGLAVSVSTLEDVIHKLKVNQNDLTLDITDVGFGLSQVLPVIVQGFLSYRNSLTIIEQPEIHLHPKMQADLADLFIDIVMHVKKKRPIKFLLIETHSEYLLKRLRRRMAEKKTVSADNVGIYFFYPTNAEAKAIIEQKEIDKDGAFDWPKNFYSGELLKDTVEFIKNQRY